MDMLGFVVQKLFAMQCQMHVWKSSGYSQQRNIFVKQDVKLTEPPDAEPHVRWCERSAAKAASYSIGIFPTGKADYFQWKRHNGERYSVQKLTFHLFISYLLYMSGSQRTVLIQKGDCSRIKNKKTKKQIRRITYLRCVSRYNSFFNKQSLVVTLSLLLLILLLTGSNNLQSSALICHNL